MVRNWYSKKDETFAYEMFTDAIIYLLGVNGVDAELDVITDTIDAINTRKFYSDMILGTTNYLGDGHTSIDIVTTDSNIYPEILEQCYTHEFFHSIISNLNMRNYDDDVRSDRLYGSLCIVAPANGLLTITDVDGEKYTASNMFLELFIDLIATLKTNKVNIDDYLKGKVNLKVKHPTDYQILYDIVKMMIIAFQNTPKLHMQESIDKSAGLICAGNRFINGIINNPLMIYDEWDRVYQEKDYLDFSYYCDLFFHKYLKSGELEEEALIEIEKSITKFAHTRFEGLLADELISVGTYQELMNLYDKASSGFKKNFFGFKVKAKRRLKALEDKVKSRILALNN